VLVNQGEHWDVLVHCSTGRWQKEIGRGERDFEETNIKTLYKLHNQCAYYYFFVTLPTFLKALQIIYKLYKVWL
jgi:hypothetical protein